MVSSPSVNHWSIKPSSAFFLAGGLLAILIVLILPQVDLLDTAFQRNTAPVLIRSQASFSPMVQVFAASPVYYKLSKTSSLFGSQKKFLLNARYPSFSVLYRSCRC